MTPPPRKYAEAPGTARSAAEIRPPADDSATAIVSFRSFSSAPRVEAIGVSSFITRSSLFAAFGAGGGWTAAQRPYVKVWAMSIPRTPMTRPGFEKLREELDRLKHVDRHSII